MKDKTKVADFYDAFTNHQMKTDVMLNDRHFLLFKKLKSLGLNTNSHVLELGCGIGVITSLISTVVKKGKITAVDISPKSIEAAKKNIFNKTNIEFIVSDILNFSYRGGRLDFITLFDVIEHIPLKDHPAVFKLISSFMNEKTILLINIPHPHLIEYDRKYHPEDLQIIDEALQANFILENAYHAGMNLMFFVSYGIWHEDDYQMIAFNKQNTFTNIKIAEKRNLFKKITYRLKKRNNKILLSSVYKINK